MLKTVIATGFHKEFTNGRNKPVVLVCVDDEGTEVEVVTKFEHRCERGANALIAESLASMIAADLDLPIPEPFIVSIDPDFRSDLLRTLPGRREPRSDLLGFGLKHISPGYSLVMHGKPLRDGLIQTAAEILAFDVLVQNSDRIPRNPNCLTNGNRLVIIDHELAFSAGLVIGWRPPWEAGGLDYIGQPLSEHLFYRCLKGQPIDFLRLIGAAEAISDQRVLEYRCALPEQWTEPESAESQMIEQFITMRSNLGGIFNQLTGVLR